MAGRPEHDLDALLDEALSAYATCEPRAGLDERIVRYAQGRQTPGRLWWAGAIAVLASVAMFIRTVPTVMVLPIQAPALPAPPVAVVSQKRVVHPLGGLPRMEKFPQPEPLTDEERALLYLGRHESEQAREALFMTEIEPLKIEPLNIEPLKIEALQ